MRNDTDEHPAVFGGEGRSAASRTLLGLLVLLLVAAVLLALWFLAFGNDDDEADTADDSSLVTDLGQSGDNDNATADNSTSNASTADRPTPVTLPESEAPTPTVETLADTQSEPQPVDTDDTGSTTASSQPDPATQADPTALPAGLEACATSASPVLNRTYTVDTNSASLKHRAEPAASSDQVGASARATRGLRPTGQCARNLTDGFTWWQIEQGGDRFWVASNFLSPDP